MERPQNLNGSVANKPDIQFSMLTDWPNPIITGGLL